ncbi:DegT/DnrJ/EryC1/StrS family aminotransferase [Candidatus Parcubacteria bacterium]|nr:DegT/DnrJ/EryC1/StrS family aminotransferase [Candidatus Parcubacteria bacterium]
MNWKIPLAQPDITNLERKAVLEVLKTPVLSLGPKLEEFEKKIAKYTGVKYAVGVNSGTSALHLIIRALGIKKGDEVITTPFSFIASANCILFERAKPVFVDIDPLTLNIDPEKIEKKITKRAKAILAIDAFGHPANWAQLEKIAKKHKLFLIEDSAEALGSEYKGKKCGSFGDAGVFAFYPNKQITTAGEGGVVLTNNKKIADLCRSMANQGRRNKDGKWLEHIRLGYNYRMPEICATIGVTQMERLNKILEKRDKVAKMYNKKLKNFSEIKIPYITSNVKISWFVYVVQLQKKYSKKDRDKIIEKMARKGIQCSDYFQSIHLQPFYRKKFGYKPGDFAITESISQRTIALPFYNNLTEKEINYIVKTLKRILNA